MSILKPQPAQSKADAAKAFAEAENTTIPANRSSRPPNGEVRVIVNVPEEMRRQLKMLAAKDGTTITDMFKEWARERISQG